MESVETFLSRDNDYGCGYGYGIGHGKGHSYGCGWGYACRYNDGYGYGKGYGKGEGSSYGCGCRSGNGFSHGFGFGDGGDDYDYDKASYEKGSCIDILSINNLKVHSIDNVPTVIYNIKGDIAKGAILRKDMTLEDCYIAKAGNYFAHGETAHSAYNVALYKAGCSISVEGRIDKFCAAHSDYTKKYTFDDLFIWHNLLTGSCELGRREWCKERGITKNDSFTVEEFCKLTQDAYGGEVIKQLIKKIKIR